MPIPLHSTLYTLYTLYHSPKHLPGRQAADRVTPLRQQLHHWPEHEIALSHARMRQCQFRGIHNRLPQCDQVDINTPVGIRAVGLPVRRIIHRPLRCLKTIQQLQRREISHLNIDTYIKKHIRTVETPRLRLHHRRDLSLDSELALNGSDPPSRARRSPIFEPILIWAIAIRASS